MFSALSPRIGSSSPGTLSLGSECSIKEQGSGPVPISPNLRSKFPWSPAPLLLEGPTRLEAVSQSLLSLSPPSVSSPQCLLLSSSFPVSLCLLPSCSLCVLCHWCLSWRQGLGLGAWGRGGAGSGQTRGPGHERNFPSFSSRPLWLGSSTEGGMSQRGRRAGGVWVGVGMPGFPRAREFAGASQLWRIRGVKDLSVPPRVH